MKDASAPSDTDDTDFNYRVSTLDVEDRSTVQLSKWKGHSENQRVHLTWQTRYERRNRGFAVEHRRTPPGEDTADWTEVDSFDGQGSTQDIHAYRYESPVLVPGTHHFRLKQIGSEGDPEYSKPLAVAVELRGPIRLTPPTPNPTQTRATLSFGVRDEQDVTIVLYDVLGRRVNTVYRGMPPPGESQSIQIDVSGMASGTYFVRLVAGNRAKTRRLVVAQ